MDAFAYICSNRDYYEGKNKRFRILFFAYMIGCISPDDLAFLFQKEDLLTNEQISKQRNLNRSILNSLAKTTKMSAAKLKKLENGFYVIMPSGIENLLFHLREKGLITEDSHEHFVKSANYRYVNCQHASMTGRALLSYFCCQGISYYIEPPLTENSELVFGKDRNEKTVYLIPDAMVRTDDEIFCIESDSGHERIKGKLVPKIQRYASSLCSETANYDMLFTLHFYLWNYKENKSSTEVDQTALKSLSELYDFQVNQLHSSIDFSDFAKKILEYESDKNTTFWTIKKALTGFDFDEINNVEKLNKLCLEQTLLNNEIKFFSNRKKALYSAIKSAPQFEEYLVRGMRFICTSPNTSSAVLKCTYIKEKTALNIMQIANEKMLSVERIIRFINIKKYTDNTSGTSYWFRNVIECIICEKRVDVIIENIDDDIGGMLRVNRINNNIKVKLDIELIFVLLSKENKSICLKDNNEKQEAKFKTVILGYSDILTRM